MANRAVQPENDPRQIGRLKQPQVLLIDGFNVWDGGQSTVSKLRSYFAVHSCPCYALRYCHFGLWDTRTKNQDIAQQIALFIAAADRPVILAGHSNGATIMYLAMDLHGAKPAHCVMINPALKASTRLSPSCLSADIWHAPSDRPVRLSRWLPKAQLRPWGEMGATGPSYEDERLNLYNQEIDFPVTSAGHSTLFEPERISFFGPTVVARALEQFITNTTSGVLA